MHEVINNFPAQEVRETAWNGGAQMDNAAAEARRAYKREWAKKNPEKIKAQQERYWQKKAAAANPAPDLKEEPAQTA